MTNNKSGYGTLGLYIHIPFCKSKCLYCDFCSFPRREESEIRAYVDALCSEIESYSQKAADYVVDSVYFGGGTPTFLQACQIEQIMNAVKAGYNLSDDVEITVECNPSTADEDYFKRILNCSVNRLSIGMQSANKSELKALGRIHSFEAAEKTVSDARKAGFSNISLDLMFGIPKQTKDSFAETLRKAVGLNPDHISCYGLQIEEGTPFYRMKDRLELPNEEDERSMYMFCVDFLSKFGIDRYEISNFAKHGKCSRHNLKYWHDMEYLGFGVSAHSYFQSARYFNTDSIDDYIDGKTVKESRKIPDEESMREFVMLALRLEEGLDLNAFFERFGKNYTDVFGKKIENYIPHNLVLKTDRGYKFSSDGMYVSNYILSEILYL